MHLTITHVKKKYVGPPDENLGHDGHLQSKQDTSGPKQSPAQDDFSSICHVQTYAFVC